MNTKTIISWALRLTVAVILLQTLYFKFTAHPDSVHIFSALGVEPWGRIGLGIVELITAILILLPKTKTIGMLTSLGIILGAVFSHFLVLGINVSNDGGGLFTLAILVLLASSLYVFLHFKDVTFLLRKLKS
ncbi:DoxX family protein [Flavobacterium filum]|uniref:DoxX family protein n=1 Tax=Flavobacterium filum TaxID=370974 RepID=UPI0023F1A132|nr:DoxX family protein [Flavobacterium filum]